MQLQMQQMKINTPIMTGGKIQHSFLSSELEEVVFEAIRVLWLHLIMKVPAALIGRSFS